MGDILTFSFRYDAVQLPVSDRRLWLLHCVDMSPPGKMIFIICFRSVPCTLILTHLCISLVIFAQGFNFNPPAPEPVPVVPNPAADGAGGVDAAVQDGAAGAGVPVDGHGAVGGAGGAGIGGGLGGVGGAGAVPAPAARAPRAPPAPLNVVQYLNVLYHSGFMIPTAPGILLDVVSLFMGLFFSIVPSWAPYRLHR